MKNLKLLIFGCGAALLVMYIVDGLDFENNTANTLIMLAAYALPALMGVMGIAKPPFQSWQGAMSLAGFGVAAVRSKIWDQVQNMPETGTGKAMLVLTIIGVVVSLLAMAKPEDKS